MEEVSLKNIESNLIKSSQLLENDGATYLGLKQIIEGKKSLLKNGKVENTPLINNISENGKTNDEKENDRINNYGNIFPKNLQRVKMSNNTFSRHIQSVKTNFPFYELNERVKILNSTGKEDKTFPFEKANQTVTKIRAPLAHPYAPAQKVAGNGNNTISSIGSSINNNDNYSNNINISNNNNNLLFANKTSHKTNKSITPIPIPSSTTKINMFVRKPTITTIYTNSNSSNSNSNSLPIRSHALNYKTKQHSHSLNHSTKIINSVSMLQQGNSRDIQFYNKSEPFGHMISKEKFDSLKEKAMAAMNAGKTFLIAQNTNGATIIRKALLRRGWIERFSTGEDKGTIHEHFIHAPDREALILSKFLRHNPVKFIWGDTGIKWSLISPQTIVNRFPQSGKSLTTKTGLLKYLQAQAWSSEDGLSTVKYPRTFSIYDDSDLYYFCSQYRITACVNILKKFCSDILEKKLTTISDRGMVDIKSIDFAIERTCEYLGTFEHAYTDFWNASIVPDADWDNFLIDYYNFTQQGHTIKNTENYELDKLLTTAEACLDKIKLYWPEVEFEGYENCWLVKPAAQSCGRGIVILKNLGEIVNRCAKRHPTIIQKYIERPLLIYNTKFDIRQWFLVTNSCPLKIYLYEKCYLRFCSKEFSLQNLHESVHLSNNSIQWKYENLKKINSKLPKQNMWDSDQFQEYLKDRGELEKWNSIVTPGIRQSIIGAMLASQESVSERQYSFNLYGADFLLTEEFTPLLIEINSSPCMRSTTDVTAKLCPMVLEDTIKVVIKSKENNSNGYFKLIFEQVMSPYQPNSLIREKDPEMLVVAKKAPIHSYWREDNKGTLIDPILEEHNKKHSHWDDRSIKYEDLCWYKSKKLSFSVVPSVNPNLSFSMPKYPGDKTSENEIFYETKPNVKPVISRWMESCRNWIARQKLDKNSLNLN